MKLPTTKILPSSQGLDKGETEKRRIIYLNNKNTMSFLHKTKMLIIMSL